MKKKTYRPPLAGELLQKLAPRIGANVTLEPEWGIAGQISFKDGKKRYFRYSSLDLNPLGSCEISKDKDYANLFMKKLGYPTVPGEAFYSKEWAEAIGSKKSFDAAHRYAKKRGLPVIVKPNSQSQGRGVALAHTKAEFTRALRAAMKLDRVVLVQQALTGRDYRVVVLDGKIISAYERIPLSITGDGRSTVRQLLAKKQKDFVAAERDTMLKPEDPRIAAKLSRKKLTLRSVLSRGEKMFLLDNANLSTGGDAVDVTKSLHPEFARIAKRLTKDMGLRLCGVDFMVDGSITEKPIRYWILEINSAPGLDHYVKSGKEQQKIVEDFYLQVLKSLAK